MFMYKKTVVRYNSGIPGCYGPILHVPCEASEDIHKILSAMSVWSGPTGSFCYDKKEFYVYEFTQETFDSPLFKQILLRYNIVVEN